MRITLAQYIDTAPDGSALAPKAVKYTLDDGSVGCCSENHPMIVDYLAKNNTIQDAD
tara:strand:- start:44 stop:214 length:171 start_codon:yes stop_codon:yes gene_type:complete